MKYDDNRSRLIFSTGNEYYCYGGIIGINMDASDTFYGCDGALPNSKFSQEERRELAKHMIDLWKKFGESQ